jgi:peptide methionine sulfoxide reductase MsrB
MVSIQKSIEENLMKKYEKSDAAIAALTPEQYRVTQQRGTEKPGTGEHLDNYEPVRTGHLCGCCVWRTIVCIVRQV